MLYTSLGFELVTVDDLDNYFEWAPATAPRPRRTERAACQGGPEPVTKEDAVARVHDDSRA